mgnify:CR=1 FL=1|jgi:hypothetical protein
MPQFKPSSRETVRDWIEGYSHVATAQPLGNGLNVVLRDDRRDVVSFQAITEKHGWYVASVDPEHPEMLVAIMPIEEVA